jgi:Zn-dependent protease
VKSRSLFERLAFHCLRIGRVFGIDIRIHWSFWAIPVLFAISMAPLGWKRAAVSVGLLFVFYGCVVLHEYGHALTARLFRVKTRDIILTPLGGIARMERIPDSPIEEIIIALAGPAVNVVLAVMLLMLLAFAGHVPLDPAALNHRAVPVLDYCLVWMLVGNIGMVVLNMMPAFPSDGGRVFRALLQIFLSRLQATQVAVYVGAFVALGLAILGVVWGNYQLPFIAMLFAFIGQMELWMVRQQAALEGRIWGESLALTVDQSAGLLPPEADFSGYSWDRESRAWVEWRGGIAVRKCRTHGW